MSIEAKIIADSVSPAGIRLTTMQLRYPRFIHSEFMTHRVFSRNASSSRAIPVERMIEELRRDPAMPVYWGSNKPGMQAGEELSGLELEMAKSNWLMARDDAIEWAEWLIKIGVHKQITNRILEPWAHINVVVTATEWDNFFELRCHKDAQPEMKRLADTMRDAMTDSLPIDLHPGDWHLPYVNANDFADIQARHPQGAYPNEDAIKVSVARCARVSYLTHDGRKTSVEEDVALYEKLVGSVPLHASPAEHQATPDTGLENAFAYLHPELHGNFKGWIQYRKTIE